MTMGNSVFLRIKNKTLIENFEIIGIFTLLTIIFTYPLIFHFNDFTLGFAGDIKQLQWYMWNFKNAIEEHKNPFFSDNIFYPFGISVWTFEPIFTALVGSIVQYFFTLETTYNISASLTFILLGYGTYLLAKELTKNKMASVLAGIIASFNPQRLGFAIGILSWLNFQWVPFYILFLYKFLRSGDSKYIIPTTIFLILVSISGWFYLAIIWAFNFLFISYSILTERFRKIKINKIKNLTKILLIYFVIMSPIFYNLYVELIKGSFIRQHSPDIMNSDLASYFLPPTFSLIYKNFIHPTQIKGNEADHTLFLGYSVVAILLIALFYRFKTKSFSRWEFLLIFFFIISLGSSLTFNGRKIFDFITILNSIPLVTSFHRFPMLATMVFLLASIVIARFFNNAKTSKTLIIIFSLLIIIEYFPITLISKVIVPPFYYEISKSNETYAILEIPFIDFPTNKEQHDVLEYFDYLDMPSTTLASYYQYFQTIHRKPILGGYMTISVPKQISDFYSTSPIIRNFRSLSLDGIENNDSLFLKQLNIRYIIVHKNLHFEVISINKKWSGDYSIPPSILSIYSEIISKLDNVELIYEDSYMLVYKIS